MIKCKTKVFYLIFRCSDALNDGDGMVKIKIIEQKAGPLYKEDLNSDVILIFRIILQNFFLKSSYKFFYYRK